MEMTKNKKNKLGDGKSVTVFKKKIYLHPNLNL